MHVQNYVNVEKAKQVVQVRAFCSWTPAVQPGCFYNLPMCKYPSNTQALVQF